MNIKEIKEMIQLMNENGLTEIELEKDGLKVRLKKGSDGSFESHMVSEAMARQAVQNQQMHQAAQVQAAAPAAAPQVAKATIKSPMVGTFYATPAPDAAPYVQVGSQVEPGQVICIIEAMKLMNEIKAEVRGKIKEILVHSGDPVEFGQALFVIE